MLTHLLRSAVAAAAALTLSWGSTALASPAPEVICKDPMDPQSCKLVIRDDGSGEDRSPAMVLYLNWCRGFG